MVHVHHGHGSRQSRHLRLPAPGSRQSDALHVDDAHPGQVAHAAAGSVAHPAEIAAHRIAAPGHGVLGAARTQWRAYAAVPDSGELSSGRNFRPGDLRHGHTRPAGNIGDVHALHDCAELESRHRLRRDHRTSCAARRSRTRSNHRPTQSAAGVDPERDGGPRSPGRSAESGRTRPRRRRPPSAATRRVERLGAGTLQPHAARLQHRRHGALLPQRGAAATHVVHDAGEYRPARSGAGDCRTGEVRIRAGRRCRAFLHRGNAGGHEGIARRRAHRRTNS